MTKESDFDYREVDSFVPSKAYRRALFTHSNLSFSVRGEGAVFSKVKWPGLEAADTSMCGAIPLLPHTLLQRDNKHKENFTLSCYISAMFPESLPLRLAMDGKGKRFRCLCHQGAKMAERHGPTNS